MLVLLRSLGAAPSDPNFLGFRDAMIAADDEAYSGAHNNLIQDTFAERGIGEFSPLGVTISGPSSIDAGQYGTWTTSVSNGNGSYAYTWYHKHSDSNNWSWLDTGSSVSTTDSEPFDLKVEVEETGGPKTGLDTHSVWVSGACKWNCQ